MAALLLLPYGSVFAHMAELGREPRLPPAPFAGTRLVMAAVAYEQNCENLHANVVADVSMELPKCENPPTFQWQEQGLHDFSETASLLRRLGKAKDLTQGKKVHAFIRKYGYDRNTFIGNCLIQMYGNCGSLDDARAAFDAIQTPNLHSRNILIQAYSLNGSFDDAKSVFEAMHTRDVVSWTAIISAATQHGHGMEAMALFHQMQNDGIEPNSITFVCILEACTILEEGWEVHSSLVKRGFEGDVIVATALVTMYGNCRSLINARSVFNTMPEKNVVSWSAMISAFSQNGKAEEALEVLHQIRKEDIFQDKVTFVCALDACASLGSLKEGQDVHADIIADGSDQDMVVGNALVTMYGKSGDLSSAIIVFSKVLERDVVSWSAIISACAQNGHAKEALNLFSLMKLEGFQPNKVTFVSVLDACADLTALEKGRVVHVAVVKSGIELDLFVGNSLVNMYGKSGSLDDARDVFTKVPHRDVISWNGMIAACAQNAQGMEALEHFHQMQNEGIEPNNVTFICAIEACMSLATLKEGQQIHAAILDGGYEPDVMVGTSLITMYGKCGSVDEARIVFLRMHKRTVIAWSAMLAACAQNGHEMEALELFHQMQHDGVKPNEITFISVLAACSHTGCFDDGMDYFATMKRDHGIRYTLDHYTCMIDLLGRAGHLEEAEDLIKSLPGAIVAAPWSSLLCACRVHGDIERAERAANQCLELDPSNASPYIELSHMYSAVGRWDDVAKVREALKNSVVKQQLV